MREKYADHVLVFPQCLHLLLCFSHLVALFSVLYHVFVEWHVCSEFVWCISRLFIYVCWFVCLWSALNCFILFICAGLCQFFAVDPQSVESLLFLRSCLLTCIVVTSLVWDLRLLCDSCARVCAIVGSFVDLCG